MSKKVSKIKKSTPLSIKHAGHVYERISKRSKEVEFDLPEYVINKIDGLVNSGQYVSRGDAIRDIIRRIIESKEPID